MAWEMRLKIKTVLFLLTGVFCSVHFAAESIAAKQPNILFVLTDDQGWSSLGCYGNQHVATPNLDRLAQQGMRFTDAYVMPQCTPTRAALLTGMHTAESGMWHVIGWYGTPWARVAEPAFRESLDGDDCRLPHRLRQAGYVTGMGGKWHLTTNDDGHYTHLKTKAASKYGFDVVAPPGQGSQNEGDKWVDHLTDHAIQFMTDHRDRPWFYYLSHHTLHGKVAAPLDLIDKHLQNGAPSSGLQNATYLAAIEHLDDSIGRLSKAVDRLGLDQETIFIFLSDNGGVDTKYMLPQWHDAPLDGSQPLPVSEQQFDNAPLREGKGSVYEGGIRVPCIVRWPSAIQAGSENNTPVHVIDWLPTLLSAAGVADSDAFDGTDLLPTFRGERLPEQSLYWYAPLYDLRWASTPAAVIRRGDWKLIQHFGDRFDRQQRYKVGAKTELFNLRDDVSENTDLAASEPARTQAMRDELLNWIRSSGAVIPSSNPHFDASKQLLETRVKPEWLR